MTTEVIGAGGLGSGHRPPYSPGAASLHSSRVSGGESAGRWPQRWVTCREAGTRRQWRRVAGRRCRPSSPCGYEGPVQNVVGGIADSLTDQLHRRARAAGSASTHKATSSASCREDDVGQGSDRRWPQQERAWPWHRESMSAEIFRSSSDQVAGAGRRLLRRRRRPSGRGSRAVDPDGRLRAVKAGGIEQSSRLEVGGDLHDLVVIPAEARSLIGGTA